MHRTNQQIVLARQPTGGLRSDDLATTTNQIGEPAAGQVLVRVVYAIVAPGQRAFMQGETFREGVHVGDVVPGQAIAEVVTSADARLRPGDLVDCWSGWQEYAILAADAVRPLGHPRLPLVEYIGLLGPNGLMAYFGMIDAGQVGRGDTVVVSAAAGGVGHVAGQIARIHGARVIGIVGNGEKARVLTEELGFDAAVDRRAPDFAARLADACADGVDLFFDNVAGAVMETVLPLMKIHGRVICCGSVSDYDGVDQFPPGPRGASLLLVTKRLTMQGVLVADYQDGWEHATDRLVTWRQHGDLRTLTTIRSGLGSAPQALLDLLAGATLGQTGIQVAPDPSP